MPLTSVMPFRPGITGVMLVLALGLLAESSCSPGATTIRRAGSISPVNTAWRLRRNWRTSLRNRSRTDRWKGRNAVIQPPQGRRPPESPAPACTHRCRAPRRAAVGAASAPPSWGQPPRPTRRSRRREPDRPGAARRTGLQSPDARPTASVAERPGGAPRAGPERSRGPLKDDHLIAERFGLCKVVSAEQARAALHHFAHV